MINFVLSNSADPDEMHQYVAFHLGFSLFAKVPVTGIHAERSGSVGRALDWRLKG